MEEAAIEYNNQIIDLNSKLSSYASIETEKHLLKRELDKALDELRNLRGDNYSTELKELVDDTIRKSSADQIDKVLYDILRGHQINDNTNAAMLLIKNNVIVVGRDRSGNAKYSLTEFGENFRKYFYKIKSKE